MFSKEVTYLGTIINQKLIWNNHNNNVISKVTVVTWICHRTFGKTCGLKPKMIYCLYKTIIKPMIMYALLVWWSNMQQTSAQVRIQKVHRLICLGITEAMPACHTAALDEMVKLPPMYTCIIKAAVTSVFGFH